MQRIVCRYRKDETVGTTNLTELRALFVRAAHEANLPLEDDRKAVLLGPALPPGATSEAERVVLELREPREPSEVARLFNAHLPAGLRVAQAWIAQPGGLEDNPAQLDEAVYEVVWQGAPPAEELRARLQHFLRTAVVPYTREREKKTQLLNARTLVRDARLLEDRPDRARLQITLSVGPQGTLRPEEFLAVLGFSLAPNTVRVHRIALHRAAWRSPASFGRLPYGWRNE